MRDMRLARLFVAGLVLGLQVVFGQIPVSFDHGKQLRSLARQKSSCVRPATRPAWAAL